MKKNVLSLAIALTIPAMAQAETIEIPKPQFYGKLNVSLQATEEGNANISEVVSNASRLGVKGKLNLNHGLIGIYQAEYETSVDDGEKDGQTFSQRNIYAGIKSDFGILKIGNFDTPFKKAQKKIDLFNNLEGDIKSAITKSDNRADNITQYSSPKLEGLAANVAHIASEDENTNDGTSASLTYSDDAIYAAVAYDTDVEDDGIDATRVVAQYSIAGATLGALWESQDTEGDDKTKDGWVYSVAYKVNSDIKVKAQYGESDIVKTDAKTYSLGVDYKLAKGAKAYAFATDEEFGDDSSKEYYGVGLEYKF